MSAREWRDKDEGMDYKKERNNERSQERKKKDGRSWLHLKIQRNEFPRDMFMR
jgi:hypothetical protein